MKKFFKNYGKFLLAVMLIAITLVPVACKTTNTVTTQPTTTTTAPRIITTTTVLGTTTTTTAPATTITTTMPPMTTTTTAPATTTTTTITTTPATTIPPAAQSVTINLTAKGLSFDKSSITVSAGAKVTVNFNNQDSGIPHNFSVYTNSSASSTVFVGQIITGPGTATYQFTAPLTPGTYFFRCDVHPASMTGSFIVQ